MKALRHGIKNLTCEIWGSHNGAGEDAGPHGYDVRIDVLLTL